MATLTRVLERGQLAARAPASWLLATYLIHGCVGRGVRLGSGSSSGSDRRRRRLEIWELGNPGIWRSGDLGIQKFGIQIIQIIQILKIQIRSAQNVGKVWISRRKILLALFGPSQAIFSMGRKNQNSSKNCQFSLVGQWALFTRFGPLLLSTLVGKYAMHTAW